MTSLAWATDATEEDVRKAFPTAYSVRVIKNRKGESAGQALVFFLSAEKAKAVVDGAVQANPSEGVEFSSL